MTSVYVISYNEKIKSNLATICLLANAYILCMCFDIYCFVVSAVILVLKWKLQMIT